MKTKKIEKYDYPTPVYKWTAESDKNTIVHCGGTNSGKTYSIIQYLLTIAAFQVNKLITVVAEDVPKLKKGTYGDAKTIISDSLFIESQIVNHNKTDRIYEFKSGSAIEFNSYRDWQDAKTGKRTHLFVNEANGIGNRIFEELADRTSEKIIIDFNPSAKFWGHKLQHKPGVDWFVSNYSHNPFIKERIKQRILSYQPTEENIKKGTANEYRWKVYGLGELARLEGLIFANYEVTQEWPESDIIGYGLDFGFTNHPTALVWWRLAHGELFVRQLVYDTGLTNPDIAEKIKDYNLQAEPIVADSAEPKSIEELNDLGCNIQPARKGKDSVLHGIQKLQNFKINVYYKSDDLIEEFGSYVWKQDKEGESTNQPIKKKDHGMDALRYSFERHEAMNDLGVSVV